MHEGYGVVLTQMQACWMVAGVKKQQALAKPIDQLLNLVLVVSVLALTLVAFFALLELILTLAAHIIVATNDSEVSSRYALITVRNIWLIAGGATMVGIVIYLIDAAFKRWRTLGIRRLFLRVLVAELAIICLQLLFAS